MKRILLSLLLLITLTVQAQRTLVHTNKVTTGHWDDVAENWLWGKEKYTVINFLMQGNTIIADDVAESTYTTLDLVVDEDNISMWNAIDENSINCSFIINKTPPETISVMYSDVIYVYEIDYIE